MRKLEKLKMELIKAHVPKLKDPNNVSDLINLKNRGGLIIPSSMIEEVCREIEIQSRIHEAALILPQKLPVVEMEILSVLEDSGKFDDLDTHLLELIVKIYLGIKIRHICRRISEVDKNIRHVNTKRILQNHQ